MVAGAARWPGAMWTPIRCRVGCRPGEPGVRYGRHMIARLATASDRERAVAAVVAAFAADPAFAYFFPDPDRFVEQAAVFAGYLFDVRLPRGTVWMAGDGQAVAMWDAPGPAQRQHSALALPDNALRRIAAYGEVVHGALPSTPHWYLSVLATHPDAAGHRFGHSAMQAGLGAAAADGAPAYLETANPANVGMYRRAGWEVTAEVRLPGLPVWIMTCAPGD
jgi:ribosomal protein S18 acetylase RimI-like enzyme